MMGYHTIFRTTDRTISPSPRDRANRDKAKRPGANRLHCECE